MLAPLVLFSSLTARSLRNELHEEEARVKGKRARRDLSHSSPLSINNSFRNPCLSNRLTSKLTRGPAPYPTRLSIYSSPRRIRRRSLHTFLVYLTESATTERRKSLVSLPLARARRSSAWIREWFRATTQARSSLRRQSDSVFSVSRCRDASAGSRFRAAFCRAGETRLTIDASVLEHLTSLRVIFIPIFSIRNEAPRDERSLNFSD